MTVWGDHAEATAEAQPGRAPGHVAALDQDPSLAGRAEAADRLDQLVLAVSLDAGDADDLARPHLEADPLDGQLAAVVGDYQVLDLEPHVARPGGLLVDLVHHRPAHNHPGQVGLA